jgi:hypothetical protein
LSNTVIEVGVEEFNVAKTFKPPGKRVKNMFSGDMAVYSPYQAKVLEGDRADFVNDAPERGAATVLVELDAEMARMSRLVTEFGLETKDEFLMMEQTLRNVSNKTQVIAKQLGSCPTGLSGAYEAPTLWGSLALVTDKMLLAPTKSEIVNEVNKGKVAGDASIKSLESKTVILAKNMMARIEKTEKELRVLRNVNVTSQGGLRVLLSLRLRKMIWIGFKKQLNDSKMSLESSKLRMIPMR